MHRGAVLCVSCGFDVRIGQRRVGEGESESVDFPVSVAARVFAALGGAFFAFFAVRVVIYASNQGASLATAILLTCFAGCAILFSLVAWRCTTRITIAKQPGIPGVATKTFKLGPIRFQRPHSLDFYDSVWFVQKPTEFTLFTVILLLLTCVGFLPGLALWIAIIRRQVVYRAELRGPGGRRRVLYFGYDDSKEKVDHLTRLVHDVSGLPLRNELGLFN